MDISSSKEMYIFFSLFCSEVIARWSNKEKMDDAEDEK